MTSTPSLSRLEVRHWTLVALLAVSAASIGWPAVGGILLGGGAIGLSLFVYEIAIRLVVKPGRARLAIGLLSVKLLAFLGLGWMAFNSGRDHRPDPVGFAAGLTCFPIAAVWEALRARARES